MQNVKNPLKKTPPCRTTGPGSGAAAGYYLNTSGVIIQRTKKKRTRLIPTVDRLYRPQGAVGVSLVVLAHPDAQGILRGGAVVVEELQALVASLGVQQSALQLRHSQRAGHAGGEVHEIP